MSLRDRKYEVPDVSCHRVSRALDVRHDRKCVVHDRRALDVSLGRRCELVEHHDRKCVVHDRRALDVSLGRRCVPDGLRSDEELRHRAPDVSHGRRCEQDGRRNDEELRHRALGDLPNDEVLHRRVNRALGVSHGRMSVLGGRHEFREVRGRQSETCCGGPEVLGSSRVACRHRLLGERRVSHVSRVPGVRHDRRCAERGLPNVMKVRQFLLRVACVDRGRRLPKHPCGELI